MATEFAGKCDDTTLQKYKENSHVYRGGIPPAPTFRGTTEKQWKAMCMTTDRQKIRKIEDTVSPGIIAKSSVPSKCTSYRKDFQSSLGDH
jgi:hypothetical protein